MIIIFLVSLFVNDTNTTNNFYIYKVLDGDDYMAYDVITRDTFYLKPLNLDMPESNTEEKDYKECLSDSVYNFMVFKLEKRTHYFNSKKKKNIMYIEFSEIFEYEILYLGYAKLKNRKKSSTLLLEGEKHAIDNKIGIWNCVEFQY